MVTGKERTEKMERGKVEKLERIEKLRRGVV